MKAPDLVRAAMKAQQLTSVRGLARRMGITHHAINLWLAGDSLPSFEHCAELAKMAGLEPLTTAAKVRRLKL
jgi:transcriptional regulator with XRE-family HTH domain